VGQYLLPSFSEDVSDWATFPPHHPYPHFARQHVLTDAVRIVYAFKRDQDPLGPDLYYANVASALSVIKTSLYLVITILFDAFIVSSRFLSTVCILRLLIPALALPMLHRLGPKLCRDPAAVPGFPRRYRFVRFLAAVINECPLIKSGIPGTGIAAVQGLSGLTKGDSVFIEKQEKITKSFLSSTVAVNGLCTCSYLSPQLELYLTVVPLYRTAVLIAYRLWTRQGTLRDARKAFGLTREIAIMAESGVIYSTTALLIIATFSAKSNSFNVFLDMVSEFCPSS
jgi:hypothetical protein